MKKIFLFIIFILCCVKISNAQVFLWYTNQMPFDGVNGVGVGNGDGIAQPGESIGMRIEIINNGGSDAHNISATFTCSDPNIVITDNTVNFFDLLSSSGDWSYDEFMFDVMNPCTTGYVTFTMNATCFEGSFNEIFLVYLDCTTSSIIETSPKFTTRISPNPSFGIFSIAGDKSINEIQVFDMMNKLILNKTVNGTIHQLDLSDYPKGIYQVIITKDDGNKISKKLVLID